MGIKEENKPGGWYSDYREERLAARVEYISRNIADWLLMGLLSVLALGTLGLVGSILVQAWLVGSGWATITVIAIPIVCVGWTYLRKWSKGVLDQRAREQMHEHFERTYGGY